MASTDGSSTILRAGKVKSGQMCSLKIEAGGKSPCENAINPYSVNWKTNRYELWGKTGYVFPEARYRSIGFQASAILHDQKSNYGLTSYNANQQSGYFNSIYQSIIGTSTHKYRTGLSLLYDKYDETLNASNYAREEIVPGAFFEYTFSYFEKFAVVAGIRGDYHNYYGLFFTPRIHTRYEVREGTVLRASAGSWTTNIECHC